MSTSHVTWQNRLPWNDYDRGYFPSSEDEIYLSCIVEITSPHYWVIPLSELQIEKYQVIRSMKDSGYTYLQISDYLNTTNYKPQRTDRFTPQQVFGLLFKMERRLTRLNQITEPSVLSVGLKTNNESGFNQFPHEKINLDIKTTPIRI